MEIMRTFFQTLPLPANALHGSYSLSLVMLSYGIAFFASYIALDLAGRMRMEKKEHKKWYWLCGGAFFMGAGIWTMHFIGMLAFILPMPMQYDPLYTLLSFIVAVFSTALAFFLLRQPSTPTILVILGGVIMGLGIVTMHYTGMAAMEGMTIRYRPTLFILSIIIAILASEAALYLALRIHKSSIKKQIPYKFLSGLVMGAAICGMHYMGMAAAVFTSNHMAAGPNIDHFSLALYIALMLFMFLTFALTLHDVSEQRKTKELEAINKKLEDYAYVTSHDLKAPLRAIENLTSWIEEDSYHNLEDHSKAHFALLKQRVSRMKRLIEDILQYSKVSKKYIEMSKVDVGVLLKEVLQTMSIPPKYTIRIGPMPHLKTAKVLLEQVFANLISNAIKHNHKKHPALAIHCQETEDSYQFCVEDNGAGISKKDQEKIFNIYETLRENNENDTAGIGLAIVYKVIERVEGNVWVESKIGHGSKFYFIWPKVYKMED